MLGDLDADTRSDMITWTATPRRVKDTCSASRQRTGHPVINQPSRHYAEALRAQRRTCLYNMKLDIQFVRAT